jgi:hypothetical protein
MKLVIKPHSVVDIITNSSTVIYTWAAANAKEMVEDLINEVLDNIDNLAIRADDLYDIEVRVTDDAMQSVADRLLNNEEDAGLTEVHEQSKNLGWREYSKKMVEYIRANYSIDELNNMSSDPYGYDYPLKTDIVVTSKQGRESKIDKILPNLFETSSVMDG